MPVPKRNGEPGERPVGIWIRVSTEDQAKGDSPEHHERRARAYAESKGWRVREVYHLEGVSGKAVLEHPETKKMIGHLRTGRISALIFSKLARLARNTRELLDFSDLFRECNADLVSLQESIDTSTPAGRLFYTMIAAMAQWEREEIADRVAASIPIRAQLGKSTGGAAPYGYQWKDKRLQVDADEAPVRKLMFELFAEHKRKKAVARILNERGYRTRNGSKWSDTTVERLIRDSSAKGQRRANYTRSLGQNKKWELKSKEDWVYTTVEAIVSEELWDECNAILEARHRPRKRQGRPAVHLFAGLVQCACGESMYPDSSQKELKYTCRKCRNKIRPEDLEAVFQGQLKAFLLSPEDIAAAVGRADEDIRTKEERLDHLRSEVAKIHAEMSRTHRLFLDDKLTSDGFGRIYGPLEERLNGMGDELPRLQGEVDFLKVQFLAKDEILSGARDLYGRWDSLTKDEKRSIVEAVVEAIRVGRDEVEIDLASFRPSSEVAGERQRFNKDSSPPQSEDEPGISRTP